MDKYLNRYRIDSTRLKKWDYGWGASYFITICTSKRICYFGRIESGKIHLNESGNIAERYWHEIPQHSPNVYLSSFVVMPNHVHGIIIINKPWEMDNSVDNNQVNRNNNIGDIVETKHALSLHQPNQLDIQNQFKPGDNRFRNQGQNTVSSIIGGYKSAVSRKIHSLDMEFKWQGRFWDHIINSSDEFVRIKNYIIDNPARWRNDDFFI